MKSELLAVEMDQAARETSDALNQMKPKRRLTEQKIYNYWIPICGEVLPEVSTQRKRHPSLERERLLASVEFPTDEPLVDRPT